MIGGKGEDNLSPIIHSVSKWQNTKEDKKIPTFLFILVANFYKFSYFECLWTRKGGKRPLNYCPNNFFLL